MVENVIQFNFLTRYDPIWLSLGPLLGFNLLMLASLAYFTLTYREQPIAEDVDKKEHTRLLSRFLKEY